MRGSRAALLNVVLSRCSQTTTSITLGQWSCSQCTVRSMARRPSSHLFYRCGITQYNTLRIRWLQTEKGVMPRSQRQTQLVLARKKAQLQLRLFPLPTQKWLKPVSGHISIQARDHCSVVEYMLCIKKLPSSIHGLFSQK